jgi:hypothetical protein
MTKQSAASIAEANQKTLVIISSQCTLNIKPVAAHFGVSETTIKRNIGKSIPGEKRFGRWYVDCVWFEAQKNKRTVVIRPNS